MPILILLFAFLTGAHVSAQADFNDGIKAYQDGDYQKASEIFFELSRQHPENPAVIYNLGLAGYQLGRKGLALGLWRKARSFSSDEQIERALSFAEEEMGMAKTNDGFVATVLTWLSDFSAFFYLSISTALFVVVGWFATTYFARRKLPLAQWPGWLFALIPCWILTMSLAVWQSLAQSKHYGTIIEADISTRTGPSLDAPTLTSLDEGSVVKIIKAYENWLQVKGESGPPGWVLKEKVIPEKGPLE